MKPFSFVHAADLHLGYSQYGLEARRQDFDNAFKELVDKTIELKPDFMIIAGDLFHQPRPSNVTLENTIRSFKRLKDAGIPVLTVDGSHDSAPNTITGTILYPLGQRGINSSSTQTQRCMLAQTRQLLRLWHTKLPQQTQNPRGTAKVHSGKPSETSK